MMFKYNYCEFNEELRADGSILLHSISTTQNGNEAMFFKKKTLFPKGNGYI